MNWRCIFNIGDTVQTIAEEVRDYSDCSFEHGEYVIPKGSVGEIIGRPLEIGGVWRIPVCFHDAPNFPALYNGDPVHPRIIGSGHYVNANILTNDVESRDFEPAEFSGIEELLNCILGE